MKSLKAVLKWSGVGLLILTALCILAIAYLFLFPGKSLFGVQMLSYSVKNGSVVNNFTITDKTPITKIIVSGGAYNVELKPGLINPDGVSAHLEIRLNALTLKRDGVIDSKIIYDDLKQTLTIVVEEPRGAYLRGISKLVVYVPASLYNSPNVYDIMTTNGDIFIGSNSSDDKTAVDKSALLPCTNSTFGTDSGSMYIQKATLTQSATFNVKSGRLFTNGKSNIDLKSTKINLSNGAIVLSESKDLETENKYDFGDIVINNTAEGSVTIDKANKVTYRGGYGQFNATKLNTLDLSATSCKVNIDTIFTDCIINSGKYGDIYIKELHAPSDITTNEGKIVIDNMYFSGILSSKVGSITVKYCIANELVAQTTKGNINIQGATRLVDASSTSGDIEIAYSKDTPFYNETNKYRSALVSTTNGAVNIIGVDLLIANAVEGGKATFNITFHDIAKQNSTIFAALGKVTVITPEGSEDETGAGFIINTNTTKNTDVKIGNLQYKISESIDKYAYGANAGTKAKLTIVSRGDILVRDSLSASI